jgi:plasmid maintenance system antidote protein VapI
MQKHTSVDWFNSLETDDLENFKLDFAVALERALELTGKSRKDLAEELEVSPARITQVLRGDANLTMEVMHKLASALGHRVHVHLAAKDAKVRWVEVFTTQASTMAAPDVQLLGASQVINHVPRYAEAA